jgi:putative hydrolase of the HAD superfamily
MNKSVLFDLDGTLLNRDASVAQFIAVQYDRLHPHLSHIPKTDYTNRFIELDCHGYVWKDKVYQDLVTQFEIETITWQALLNDYEKQFQFHWRGEFQNRAISGLGIQNYFDVILISEIEGVRKPTTEIFQRAMTRLGVSAQDSVFVGDNPAADILGAKSAGMRAIWKRSAQWLEAKGADASIDDLSEIPSILELFNERQYGLVEPRD